MSWCWFIKSSQKRRNPFHGAASTQCKKWGNITSWWEHKTSWIQDLRQKSDVSIVAVAEHPIVRLAWFPISYSGENVNVSSWCNVKARIDRIISWRKSSCLFLMLLANISILSPQTQSFCSYIKDNNNWLLGWWLWMVTYILPFITWYIGDYHDPSPGNAPWQQSIRRIGVPWWSIK